MKEYICTTCSKCFVRYKSQIKNPDKPFCSKSCFDEHRRFTSIVKKCLRCETEWVAPHGQSKEYRRKFCSQTCKNTYLSERYTGKRKNTIKGWRMTTQGYVEVFKPDHPRANSQGYVKRMVLAMEEKIGRVLNDKEVVHHIDKNKTNDSPENLMLFSSNAEHIGYHYHVLGDKNINRGVRKRKLSSQQVSEIRKIYNQETKNKSEIARRYDVSSNTIGNVLKDLF